jgi:hypothetical protein
VPRRTKRIKMRMIKIVKKIYKKMNKKKRMKRKKIKIENVLLNKQKEMAVYSKLS